ncbi:DUF167 domain-containing protein [Candidatus Roizmanbacteria bacterium]|jgi:hypothetical protein|nr:DUF167 domain-containing protein [Candidatus Roizmanbacteria bacterium]
MNFLKNKGIYHNADDIMETSNMFIKVKVFPSSKKKELIKKSEDQYIAAVKEKAERGFANRSVVDLLSCHFKIPGGKIKLIKGSRSRNKIFEV